MVLLASTALALSLGAAAPTMAEPVKIRVVSKDFTPSNPDDVKHLQRIEEALRAQGTDLDIELVDLPSSGYADKLSVMLLSGDIPDLIYFQGGDAKMVEQGVLEDLGPMLADTKYLKDALWPHNVERLKNYPYLLYVYPVRGPQPVIRKDWLEKTGLKAPETVEDYVTLFKAIKDGDLDGNGVADSYGVTTADNTNELDSIFNQAFGITGTWMKNAGGEWVQSRITSQEKDKIAFYASLREQGLYDPEYITTKFDVKEDKFYTGRAGVIFGSSGEVIDIYGGKMRQVHPGTELVLLAPPKGPGGQGLAAVDVSKESRGLAISAISEHKAEVMKLLDFMASPEGQMFDRLGFEGQEYTKDGDSYKVTDKIATWYARFMVAANWTPPVVWQSEAAQQSLATIQKDFKPDNTFVWPADYAADLDATENVYRSWVYKFISGAAKMDQWDQYVAEWEAAGGKRLNEYARTVLDAEK
ncbi:ABC transporter substrate-binding protein [Ensifer sp. Root1252]|nr:ABC transporter substrate-binding protein [Ensifer sp. Root31]KQW61346.1 ABC transporter substrate-binding protein [Ensifer sp. Root1252]KQW82814.1 ABC transporter substrate-binding protein [Ensifer sp. Root127]KRC59877.1 ABC transporter substrate-binding protein [Ensifer sp. Root231]KRD01339.1 ABC transporter substrate-binding protein [Ensifer sp. Root258]OMQ41983.1 ABC transporter substrate-binding protein [Ensifer sp. 1H6]UBI79170.1 extracellular solute-binding protein [Ensifer canadens